MTKRTPAVLRVLCVGALSLAGGVATAAAVPEGLHLPAGAHVGVVDLLDAEVTHFHASRRIEDSFLRTYPVHWSVNAMLLGAVRDRLARLGLAPELLPPSDELRHAREECFLHVALARGLPRECALVFAHFANAQRLSAIIVLGPGLNDAAHAGGERHRELPDYLRGWCFVTGEDGAESAPKLLNFTELLLIGLTGTGAELDDREWGGDGPTWRGYHQPLDLKAIPDQQLDQLESQFDALLRQQADELLMHIQVNH
jgi:hypothetical protein